MSFDLKATFGFKELEKVCPDYADRLERDIQLEAAHANGSGMSLREAFIREFESRIAASPSSPVADVFKTMLNDPSFKKLFCGQGVACTWVAKQAALGQVKGVPQFEYLLKTSMRSAGKMFCGLTDLDIEAAQAVTDLVTARNPVRLKTIADAMVAPVSIPSPLHPTTTIAGPPNWSFKLSKGKIRDMQATELAKLPCRLALPYHLKEVSARTGGQWIAYSHVRKPNQQYLSPTTFDASVLDDNSMVYDVGGFTKPMAHCASSAGYEEVIHPPINFIDIVGIPNDPDVESFVAAVIP